jgi:hypothetical protein
MCTKWAAHVHYPSSNHLDSTEIGKNIEGNWCRSSSMRLIQSEGSGGVKKWLIWRKVEWRGFRALIRLHWRRAQRQHSSALNPSANMMQESRCICSSCEASLHIESSFTDTIKPKLLKALWSATQRFTQGGNLTLPVMQPIR